MRGVCREDLLWSMVVNHKLTIPQKGVVDARPFGDKAKPRVNYSHLNTVTITDTILSSGTHSCPGGGVGTSPSIAAPQEDKLEMEEEPRAGRGRPRGRGSGRGISSSQPTPAKTRMLDEDGDSVIDEVTHFWTKRLHSLHFLDKKDAFLTLLARSVIFLDKNCILFLN